MKKTFCGENGISFSGIKTTAFNLWSLSYPTMAAFALQSLYDLADMAWVGRISKTALSGVAVFSTVYLLFTVLNEVAGASSVSMISQSYGRKDDKAVQKIAEQTISFKAVLAVCSGCLLGLLLMPILRLYTNDGEVIKYALEYGIIRIFFIPVMFLSYSVNTIFRCTGDAKTPMVIMIICAALNIILDPIFMFSTIPGTNLKGLGLGVQGAAFATVTASGISFLYGFLILLKGRRQVKISLKGLFVLDKKIDSSLLRIGMPSGINLLLRNLSLAIIMKFVALYGTDALALAGIGSKIIQFAFMPIFGFSMGGAAMVGHALGRENIVEAKTASYCASLFAGSIVSFFSLTAYFFPQHILSLFLTDLRTIHEGIIMVRLLSISVIPLAFAMGLAVVFSGSGHNRPLLYASIGSRWGIQITFLFLAVKIIKLPLPYVWVSYIAGEITEFLIIVLHYKKGVWQTKRV